MQKLLWVFCQVFSLALGWMWRDWQITILPQTFLLFSDRSPAHTPQQFSGLHTPEDLNASWSMDMTNEDDYAEDDMLGDSMVGRALLAFYWWLFLIVDRGLEVVSNPGTFSTRVEWSSHSSIPGTSCNIYLLLSLIKIYSQRNYLCSRYPSLHLVQTNQF